MSRVNQKLIEKRLREIVKMRVVRHCHRKVFLLGTPSHPPCKNSMKRAQRPEKTQMIVRARIFMHFSRVHKSPE